MALTLDPQIADALAPIAAAMAGTAPPPVGDVPARRVAIEGLLAQLNTARPAPADITTTDHHLSTADGATIRLRWYAKQGAPNEPGPAAVYFHSSGMIFGNIDLFDGSVAHYVSMSGTPILSVDYRRAPEHPYPTPLEDAYAGLVWLHDHAAELGISTDRVAVFGDSAGGGLAAAVSILARDRRGPAIAKQILLMPMLDDRTIDPDPHLAPFVSWSWDDNRTGWGALLGDAAGGPDVPTHAAPARVADLSGLPPTYIDVGQLDIFRDESITYALRLSQAGVPVEFHLNPGVPHLFEGIAFDSDVVRRIMNDRTRALVRSDGPETAGGML